MKELSLRSHLMAVANAWGWNKDWTPDPYDFTKSVIWLSPVYSLYLAPYSYQCIVTSGEKSGETIVPLLILSKIPNFTAFYGTNGGECIGSNLQENKVLEPS